MYQFISSQSSTRTITFPITSPFVLTWHGVNTGTDRLYTWMTALQETESYYALGYNVFHDNFTLFGYIIFILYFCPYFTRTNIGILLLFMIRKIKKGGMNFHVISILKQLYCPSTVFFHFRGILSRYLRAVRPLPQNSAKAKKLGGGSTARKSPIDAG
ncbi:hypothetical protein IGI01_12045 [Bacillus thuringiensis]|nr:hypothetical protein [Bacillus thuringiensis]